ncbi:MAG: SDR family oxidoreductase [Acidobacteriia bacterium]|nr:SDR family oxidoreductase [Terriglobia bacterium]
MNVLVTGGAGYVGAVLAPKLLSKGHTVKVIDLYMYGDDVLSSVKACPRLTEIKGDIRDTDLLEREIPGTDAIIHLACISNDPSYELDPDLGRSINFDAFGPLVAIAKRSKVRRFIYASSSSVYGVKDEPEVTEDLSLEPLTDYALYKAKCEEILLQEASDDFEVIVIRPATICGYSPRMRLDLTVNLLTNHAVNKGKITVLGGDQKRPNLHVADMTDLYVLLLDLPKEKIQGKVFNAGCQNCTVREIAKAVQNVVGPEIPIETTATDDIRSYHVSSRKIREELGFEPRHTVEEAIMGLRDAFKAGKIPDPMTDTRYYNVKRLQAAKLEGVL